MSKERTNEELEALVDSLKPTDGELADWLDEILLVVSVEDRDNIREAAARLRANDGERIEGCISKRGFDVWVERGLLPVFYRKDHRTPTMPATLILRNPKESESDG